MNDAFDLPSGFEEVDLSNHEPEQGATLDAPLRTFDRLRLRHLNEVLDAPPRDYLLKGILAPGEFSVSWGAPKCGKSFLVVRLVFGMALGIGMWGMRAKPARVLYIAALGEGGLGARLKVLRDKLGDPGDAFQLILQRAVVGRPGSDLRGIVAAAQSMKANLVVIDTLARTFGEGDENLAADMNAFVAGVDMIREESGAHVICIHHGTSTGANGRGSSALDGAADAIIKVEKGKDGQPSTATIVDAKDSRSGGVLPFYLRVVEMGTDEDGDSITTCIAEEAENAASKSRTPKLGVHEAIVMQAFERLGRGRMRVKLLLSDVVQHMVPPADGERDRRRDNAARGLQALGARQILFVVGDHVAEREPDARAGGQQ